MSTQDVPSMDFRRSLASKARYKNSRVTEFSQSIPTDWSPHKVNNPKTGFYFTDDSAWNFIADLLENPTCEAIFKELDKPKGVKAVVILRVLEEGKPLLYIKVHFGRDKIIGRSFHYSYMEGM
ncbi:MAG: hypothetical protein EOO53_00680 [Gammaproteobacteria bacterium]|nr:MAG: hypothetical protein EOO53_00680 [Gammaproteobacteria bacterium]